MVGDSRVTKKRAKDIFEAWANGYDRSLLNHFLFRPACHLFLEELVKWRPPFQRPMDLLDVGCGTGTLCCMIAASGIRTGHLLGADYAMQMCRKARQKADGLQADRSVPFVGADSEHLPFPDGSFDVVTCANSFHHYPQQQQVVCEMHRVLRPGGRLMIIDGFRDNTVGWVVYDVIITKIEKNVYHAPWSVMRRYFEHAGFQDVYHRKFNILFPAFITVGTRASQLSK